MITCIYANNDKNTYGQRVCQAARKIGVPAYLFEAAAEVPDNPGVAVSLNLHHGMARRQADKQLARDIAAKKHVAMFPSLRECELYDDKVAQSKVFGDWMPQTYHIVNTKVADQVVRDSLLPYPFLSKSSHGASASNIRMIHNAEEAMREATIVFTRGLPCVGGIQKGYLLWQRFLPDNDGDWRINMIGERYGLICQRFCRADAPFASGSDMGFINWPRLTNRMRDLLDFGQRFYREHKLFRVALDIIFDERGEPKICESSAFWGDRVTGYGFYFEHDGSEWKLYSGDYGCDPELIVETILERCK